jgi:hypothetical protein
MKGSWENPSFEQEWLFKAMSTTCSGSYCSRCDVVLDRSPFDWVFRMCSSDSLCGVDPKHKQLASGLLQTLSTQCMQCGTPMVDLDSLKQFETQFNSGKIMLDREIWMKKAQEQDKLDDTWSTVSGWSLATSSANISVWSSSSRSSSPASLSYTGGGSSPVLSSDSPSTMVVEGGYAYAGYTSPVGVDMDDTRSESGMSVWSRSSH